MQSATPQPLIAFRTRRACLRISGLRTSSTCSVTAARRAASASDANAWNSFELRNSPRGLQATSWLWIIQPRWLPKLHYFDLLWACSTTTSRATSCTASWRVKMLWRSVGLRLVCTTGCQSAGVDFRFVVDLLCSMLHSKFTTERK